MSPTLTVLQVIDNNDNSLTVVGSDTDDNQYTTSMGRKSDAPDSTNLADPDNMTYYQTILAEYAIPVSPTVVYTAPGYTSPTSQSD